MHVPVQTCEKRFVRPCCHLHQKVASWNPACSTCPGTVGGRHCQFHCDMLCSGWLRTLLIVHTLLACPAISRGGEPVVQYSLISFIGKLRAMRCWKRTAKEQQAVSVCLKHSLYLFLPCMPRSVSGRNWLLTLNVFDMPLLSATFLSPRGPAPDSHVVQ